MMNNSVRAAVVGTLVTPGLLGGTAGIAEAQTPARTETARVLAEPVLSSTVDALQAAPAELSTAADPARIDALLAQVLTLLQQYPPLLLEALLPTYQWLVTKLGILRGLLTALPLPQLVPLIINLARSW